MHPADVEAKKVAGIITIPSVQMGVTVVFEPAKDYLLVVEPKWEWMLMLDLKNPAEPAIPPR
jgi:hypothetical protein